MSASTTATKPLSTALILLMATATGLAVASNYYAQPLLHTIAQQLGLSMGSAGTVVITAQLSYGAGLLLLVGLAWVILRGSAKLPLALFFGINAALLCALSVVFAGHGVKALQEAGIFGTRPVAFFDFDWLGIHADAYSLSAQAVAILAIVVLYGRSRLAEKRRATA